MGTPYYWAPELLDGKSFVAGSDLWGLGVIAFELLTLVRPFEAETLSALAIQVYRADANGVYDRIQDALNQTHHPASLTCIATRSGLLNPEPEGRMPLGAVLEATEALLERTAETQGQTEDAPFGQTLRQSDGGPRL